MIICYIDGACTYNPHGSMGWGGYVKDQYGTTLYSFSESCEPREGNSNNVAEYLALEVFLEWASRQSFTKYIIYSDSNMLVLQMTAFFLGKKTKNYNGFYADIAYRCRDLLRNMNDIDFTFKWIPREQNSEADELSKKTLKFPTKKAQSLFGLSKIAEFTSNFKLTTPGLPFYHGYVSDNF